MGVKCVLFQVKIYKYKNIEKRVKKMQKTTGKIC